MAAWVYDSRHLQADCQEPGLAHIPNYEKTQQPLWSRSQTWWWHCASSNSSRQIDVSLGCLPAWNCYLGQLLQTQVAESDSVWQQSPFTRWSVEMRHVCRGHSRLLQWSQLTIWWWRRHMDLLSDSSMWCLNLLSHSIWHAILMHQ